MENLDKKSNLELQTLKKELKDEFEFFRFEVVKAYDHWVSLDTKHTSVTNELKKRGLL